MAMEGYLLRSDKNESACFPLNTITFTKLDLLQHYKCQRTVAPWTNFSVKELKTFVNGAQTSANGLYTDNKQSGFQKPAKTKNFLFPLVLLVGLITTAVFLAKIIAAVAEKVMVSNEVSKIAPANISTKMVAGRNFQNAIVRELVPPAEKPRQLPRPDKRKDIKKQIKLQATHYKTGVSDAISDVQLVIFNHSAYFVNQVVVEVNYIKSDGKIIETDTYQVRSLRPNSSQLLFVPHSKPGAKMKYKVKNIYALQPKSLMRIV